MNDRPQNEDPADEPREEPWTESIRKGIARGTVARPCRIDKSHGEYRGSKCPRCD